MTDPFSQSPHDRFARKVFSVPENALALVRGTLPAELLARLDLDTLKLVDATLIDDRLREHITDLLFVVRCDGKPLFLYLLIEHKSTFDRWTPLQVHGYKMQLWLELRRQQGDDLLLPDILSIVLYHGDRAIPDEWYLHSLFAEPRILPERLRADDGLLVLDLAQHDDDWLRELSPTHTPMAALGLLLLKSIRREHILQQLRQCADLIRGVLARSGGESWLATVVNYLLGAAPDGPSAEEIRDTMNDIAGSEAGDIVMTTADKLIAEGVEKGIEQGIEQARRDDILKFLRARFGEIPAQLVDSVGRITDLKALDRLIESAARAMDLGEFRETTGT